MGKAILHIGLHKTGTTSFQSLMSSSRERLMVTGLCYPLSGMYLFGHSFIASELLESGTSESLSALHHELEDGSLPPCVLLSSENFEHLHRFPDRLGVLEQALARSGYDVFAAATLREPADYVESLYWELSTKHHMALSLDQVVRSVLDSGAFHHNGLYFCLDYEALLEPFDRVLGGARVVALPYNALDAVSPLCAAVEALSGITFSVPRKLPRINARDERRHFWQLTPAGGRQKTRPKLSPQQRAAVTATLHGSYERALTSHRLPGTTGDGGPIATTPD